MLGLLLTIQELRGEGHPARFDRHIQGCFSVQVGGVDGGAVVQQELQATRSSAGKEQTGTAS